jgi:hypothetical protein
MSKENIKALLKITPKAAIHALFKHFYSSDFQSQLRQTDNSREDSIST